jgi:hypothetical protein
MPDWLAAEIQRVTTPRPAPNRPRVVAVGDGWGPAVYLATVIARGAAGLARMTDGRQRALSALAYHIGGLLGWSGVDVGQVTGQLVDAGITSGLPASLATRIVRRALANGIERPVTPPGSRA